ncbi:MBL fold metallo-hydrolase [Rhodococcus sp. BP-252]|uniref:MBL fold metallo-hydrolase n=1 Tax=unclassified Rhodococcus (in: high G+C Gram-positive bacteria) TaxID=192944 RepID=UPI00142F68D9|nr:MULTISPECIES: MBL fold metallo-hydrolase [unclassified Rhodococcus (in: high G+C Gram-positive bacteria)]MBY6411149.1 MBL fold metallo-hydrolase [Rhodococcus sp. BP-320]MBY6415808.1 MBL fold metallo-hydrolase [Rhodococcus sp. BP-321]MBY6424371.1 MBL fold metallo-hydrolase [Rhodococcus sp. BP-324]MBY6425865.1 MBL fold metallo-hydrolase [Rhodococcus sp. BP-323]MBY6431014.1 MBL fold metallo-hydrolase [Rhodococcus sp. BP-322]
MTNEIDTRERLRRPSGVRSLTLGETKLTYVPDGVARLDARMLLPEPSEEDWAQNAEYLDEDGHLVAGVGGLLVERDGHALLIDAGVGPLTIGPPMNPFGVLSGGALLDNLARIGCSPADIDAVALTHLHTDHFGWAWHPAPGSTRPAFTEADYLVAETEWANRHVAEEQGQADMIKALAPHVRTVVENEEVFPGVRVMSAPGHSPGHSGFVIEADGQRVIAFGDAFHSPVQITHPLWENTFDHDHRQATALRHRLVLELAGSDAIGFGIHFADVPFGRVRIEDNRATWHPVDD